MPQETEIKLRIADLEAFRKSLSQLKAKPVFRGSGRVHEMNLIFDTSRGGLAKKAQLLRIRTETPANETGIVEKSAPTRGILTFKRPSGGGHAPVPRIGDLPAKRSDRQPKEESAGGHKVRDEIETVVTDPATLAAIFEGIGMHGWFRYEKYRTTYRLSARWAKGLLIELDETPIGNFAELEGPPKKIDRAARELGFSKADYIVKSYLTLYREDCRRRGVDPSDMVFSKRHRPSSKKKGSGLVSS
jgi:adenylate cyclase class 2